MILSLPPAMDQHVGFSKTSAMVSPVVCRTASCKARGVELLFSRSAGKETNNRWRPGADLKGDDLMWFVMVAAASEGLQCGCSGSISESSGQSRQHHARYI